MEIKFPVKAIDWLVMDDNETVVAECRNSETAAELANLLNKVVKQQ